MISLSGWEEVKFGKGFPWLVNTPIIPAGLHWGSQSCRNPRLVFTENIPRTPKITTENTGSFTSLPLGYYKGCERVRKPMSFDTQVLLQTSKAQLTVWLCVPLCFWEDTCATGATLLGISHRILTAKSWTLYCVTFHIACLRERRVTWFIGTHRNTTH